MGSLGRSQMHGSWKMAAPTIDMAGVGDGRGSLASANSWVAKSHRMATYFGTGSGRSP